MRIIPIHPAVLILIMMSLISCGKQAVKEVNPADFLQVEPIRNTYIHFDSRSGVFRIGNEFIERRIFVDRKNHRIFTTAFINKLSQNNYVRSANEEFSFRANGVKLSGISGDFEYLNNSIYGYGQTRVLEINLVVKRTETGLLNVKLVYEAYPHIPVIRKWFEIHNPSGSSVRIDSINVESISLLPGSKYDIEVYEDPQFVSGSIEALSPIVFNSSLSEGFIIGNEAPGVLKYTDIYPDSSIVSIGMNPISSHYAPKINLEPDGKFNTPPVFVLLFKGGLSESTKLLYNFIEQYLAWSKLTKYSVWYEDITPDMLEQQMLEKVRLAKESGADVFCISSRQTDMAGDNAYIVKLGEYVRNSGMKFGLSVDLAIVDKDSQVLAENPDWVIKLKDGSDYTITDSDSKAMCLGSRYAIYAAYEIDALVKEINLDYVRLAGILIPDNGSGGCYAESHIHQSPGESLWSIYAGFFAVIKYLHSMNKHLTVDVWLKSYNPPGVPDYAILKQTDVNWQF